MSRKIGAWIGAACFFGVIAIGGYVFWFSRAPLGTDGREFTVPPGMTLRAFSRELSRAGILPDRWTLVWLARVQGKSRALKAGEYRFRPGMTAFEILDQVVSGRVIEYPFTIVDGWTFQQVLAAMRSSPRISHTLDDLTSKEIMARLGRPGLHPEGRFFPDTYYHSSRMSDLSLLKRALERMDAVLDSEWEARDRDVPLKTPAEALVLASIVEKETGDPDERPMIAGVFVRRLRMGMRLQTDPTVIYGLGDSFDGNLRLSDLRRPTPWNTYVIRGLPPTPIAMPGRDAIHAALHPQDTDAVYFVSRGDGTHEFTETLAAHNRAVARFQNAGQRSAQ
jgi:UPF0755 protein